MLVTRWFAAMASEALAFSTDSVRYAADKCVCSDGKIAYLLRLETKHLVDIDT